MELGRHLELLLFENDCVIIPDFGGFITHYSPARLIEEEQAYFPPIRTIAFNPHLKMNDGLLIQSYMQVSSLSFVEAEKEVKRTVDELIDVLYQKGYVCFQNIGELSVSIDNTYTFSPVDGGVNTPNLYGLHSFNIAKLAQDSVAVASEWLVREPAEIHTSSKRMEQETKSSSPHEIKISPSFFRYAVATAAAVLLFFFLSAPVENTFVEEENYARLFSFASSNTIQNKKVDEIKPKVVREEAVEKPLQVTVESLSAVETSRVAATTSAGQQPAKSTTYYEIIVASMAPSADFAGVIEQYKKRGYANASVIDKDGRLRVSLVSYSNKQEAMQALSQIRQVEEFKTAWILPVKR